MDVLAPRTLTEALRLKAEQPEARPIQGGTDLMVALNFDRARPEVILDLNRVAELRGWSREGGAHRRLAADPQPRHDRGEPRHLVAGRGRAAASDRRGRRDRVPVGARVAP